MLSKLHVRNFKCLYDVTVDLDPFTILIGPNDSGKSSFVDAVQSLGRLAKEQIPQVFNGTHTITNIVSLKEVGRAIEGGRSKGSPVMGRFITGLEIGSDGRALFGRRNW